jgi:hypothetical protein
VEYAEKAVENSRLVNQINYNNIKFIAQSLEYAAKMESSLELRRLFKAK